jgi:hypothetical protein
MYKTLNWILGQENLLVVVAHASNQWGEEDEARGSQIHSLGYT